MSKATKANAPGTQTATTGKTTVNSTMKPVFGARVAGKRSGSKRGGRSR